MNRKLALSIFTLLAAATADSHAAFQVTFRAGDAVRTIVDGGVGDTSATPNEITANAFTLTDSTDLNFEYTFSQIRIDWSSFEGLDGVGYSINAAVQMDGKNASSKGKTVSMFGSVTDLTSIIGEPAQSIAGGTFDLRTPYPAGSTIKVADITYGAYYDTTNTLATTPTGSSILAGTNALQSRSSPEPNNTQAFSGIFSAPTFSTSTFGMSVFYSAAITSNTFTGAPRLSFGGSSQLEQAPEPSHTALPVGIATGLFVMRRRRVTR